MTWLYVGGQRQGHILAQMCGGGWAGGEDIHVDAGASKSTSSMLAVVMKCL